MKETATTGGFPAYTITIRTIFTSLDLIKALAQYSIEENALDYSKLKKRHAMKVLSKRIAWHGRAGSLQNTPDLSEEFADKYNAEDARARAWVEKNYPYLIQKQHP